MGQAVAKPRESLSGDGLFSLVRSEFKRNCPKRTHGNVEISTEDALMSAFAMFSLKDPSLLAFEHRANSDVLGKNLRAIYHIGVVPSDTQMRKLIDIQAPECILPIYRSIFRELQRGKALEKYVFLDGHYLVAMDGTGYFSSDSVHCDSCLTAMHKKTGEVTYSHSMLAAVIVHPAMKEVIPLAPEAIIKQDGETKNDCERNAAKRLLPQIRKDHPHLKIIVVEDSLASNAPHIQDLRDNNMRFILGVKKGDHAFLFDLLDREQAAGNVSELLMVEGNVTHRFRFINNVPLNDANQNVLVNFIEYWEDTQTEDGIKRQHFSWVTDIAITKDNAYTIMRGGRTRWKIENETFNTLKNQGYNYEHNFGHGEKNLSVNLALLMMLSFLVDQVQQLCCKLFQAARVKCGSKRTLWETIRVIPKTLPLNSWQELLSVIAFGVTVTAFQIGDSS